MTAQVETLPERHRFWLYALSGIIGFVLILPILLIVPMSFSDTSLMRFPPQQWSLRWYENFFGTDRWLDAAKVSFIVAFWTVLLATPAGTLAAYAVRTSRRGLSEAIWAIVMAPLVVPIVLLGIGLYFTYAWFGMNNTYFGLVLAHAMHAVPYVFITMHSAFQSFDLNQPRVAQSLGASPIRAFLDVTLPQLRLSLFSAAFLAFLSSFDEVVIALFISGGAIPTLPKMMFTELRMSLDPTISAVSSLMLTLALLVLAFTQFVALRQKRTAS